MTVTPQVEGRSTAARSAARAHLQALRAARVRRREKPQSDAPAVPAQEAAEPAPEDLHQDPGVAEDTPFETSASDPFADSTGEEPEGADFSAMDDADLGSDTLVESPGEDAEEPLADAVEAADETATEVQESSDELASAPAEAPEDLAESPHLEACDSAPEETSAEETTLETTLSEEMSPEEASHEETSPEKTGLETEEPTPEASPKFPEDSALFQLPGAGPGLVWMLHQADITSLEDLAQAEAGSLRQTLGVVGEIIDLDYWIDWAKENAT